VSGGHYRLDTIYYEATNNKLSNSFAVGKLTVLHGCRKPVFYDVRFTPRIAIIEFLQFNMETKLSRVITSIEGRWEHQG